MDDLGQLIKFLNTQSKRAVLDNDWDDVTKFRIVKEGMQTPGDMRLTLEDLQIGFNFNKDGEFQGIFNWKE